MGWALGIVEAVCVVLVSGLAVDYVLHVACAFAQARAPSRIERTTTALQRMGSPLLAGTTTTLVSALSLCMCTFTVLVKIGAFMAFTAVWSYLTAQTLLPALLATFGPPFAPACTRSAQPASSRSHDRGVSFSCTADGGVDRDTNEYAESTIDEEDEEVYI